MRPHGTDRRCKSFVANSRHLPFASMALRGRNRATRATCLSCRWLPATEVRRIRVFSYYFGLTTERRIGSIVYASEIEFDGSRLCRRQRLLDLGHSGCRRRACRAPTARMSAVKSAAAAAKTSQLSPGWFAVPGSARASPRLHPRIVAKSAADWTKRQRSSNTRALAPSLPLGWRGRPFLFRTFAPHRRAHRRAHRGARRHGRERLLFGNELQSLGGGNAHHEGNLLRRIGRVPMPVHRHMAMPVVASLGLPVLLVAIVMSRVLPLDRRIREAVRPHGRHAMRAFDPAAESTDVLQAVPVLRFPGKTHQLELDRRMLVRLNRSGRMRQGGRRHVSVEMLIDE